MPSPVKDEANIFFVDGGIHVTIFCLQWVLLTLVFVEEGPHGPRGGGRYWPNLLGV
jgi:hypothetical protein